MAGTSLALSLTGALGLILLGAWMSTEGMRYVAGGAWRRLLLGARLRPICALRAGVAASVLVPSTHTLMRASIVAGSSGSLGVPSAMLLGVGVSFAAVAAGGWAVLFATSGAGHLPGFVLLCVAALASRLPRSRRPLGARELLGGLGLALLGMSELFEVSSALGELGRLDAWKMAFGLKMALCIGMGAAAAWFLQTPSGAVATGILLGAGGLLGVSTTAAYALGAFAGGALACLVKLASSEADDRRVALGLGAHHVLCLALGLLFLPWLPALASSGGRLLAVSAPVLLLAAAVVGGTIVSASVSRPLARLLDRMFVEVGEDVGGSAQVDPSLGVYPDLLVEGARRRLARQALLVRVMTRAVLGGAAVTERRLQSDLERIRNLNDGLAGAAKRMRRMRLNESLAGELPEIARASSALRTIADCAAELRAQRARLPRLAGGDPLANRMRQLEAMYLNAVESCAPTAAGGTQRLTGAELAGVQRHTRDLSAKILAACERQHVAVDTVAGYLERLACLERLGDAALETAEGLAGCRMESLADSLGAAPAAELADEEPEIEGEEEAETPKVRGPRIPTADLHGWTESVVVPRPLSDTVVMQRPLFGPPPARCEPSHPARPEPSDPAKREPSGPAGGR